MTVIEFDGSTDAQVPEMLAPPAYPVVGHLPAIRRDPLRYVANLVADYGDVIPLKLGPHRVLMANHPDHIKHVLQDNFRNYRKSDFYESVRPLLGNGIFMSDGDDWLSQRRTMVPAFQGVHLTRIGQAMTSAIGDMLERWQGDQLSGRPFDITAEMMKVTLDALVRALFGTRSGTQTAAFYDAVTVVLERSEKRVWALANLPLSIPTPSNLKFVAALKELDAIVSGMIEQRRANPATGEDLLSMLMAAYDSGGSEPDLKLLRDQVMSMLLAGHETTANALNWTWYLLSKNPSVERRVRDEVLTAIGDRTPEFADLPKLNYTKMVFEEAMRLYPPVWTMSRAALEPDRLGDHEVTPGTTIMLCPYAVQRNPRYWPNPEGFDPDRFSAEAKKARPRYAYFPFGGGARVCLGQHFATMEAQLLIAMVMQRCRLDLVPGQTVEPQPMITLRPKDKVMMVAGSAQAEHRLVA